MSERRCPNDRLVDLLHGAANPLTVWRLRRHLARCPRCRQELERNRALWAQLSGLRDETPPLAPNFSSALDTPRVAKGIPMKRRFVLAAGAAVLLAAGGSLAAQQFPMLFHYQAGLGAPDGTIWNVTSTFRGEVILDDAQGRRIGSYSNNDGDTNSVTAKVGAGRRDPVTLKGPGRFGVFDKDGRLLGHATLIPQSREERERAWAEHERQNGIDRRPPGEAGSMGGFGFAEGYIASDKFSYRLEGVASVKIRDADGSVIQTATASAIPDDLDKILAQMPAQFRRDMPKVVPKTPSLRWQSGADHGEANGFGNYPVRLPGGRTITIEVSSL